MLAFGDGTGSQKKGLAETEALQQKGKSVIRPSLEHAINKKKLDLTDSLTRKSFGQN